MTESGTRCTVGEIRQRFGVELGPDEKPLCYYTRHGIVLVRRTMGVILALIPLGVLAWSFTLPTPPIPFGLEIGIVAVVYLAIVLAVLYYFYNDWRNDALILTDQRLIHIELVILISQAQRETVLRNVQNVRMDVPGFLARLLGYGTIEIETAARGTDIFFGPISQPRAVQQEIMQQVRAIQADRSARLMQETLLYRLDPDRYSRPRQPFGPADDEGQGTPRRQIHLPFLPPNPLIEGETITWHKHGFFLLYRLFRPILVLAILVGFAFLLSYLKAATLLWVLWGGGILYGLGYLVWSYQVWKGDVYVLTADSFHDIYRTPFGLFGESRRSAGLERIQNISSRKPGLLANLLNYGNVLIQTAGEEDFTFNRVPRPEQVQRDIYRHQEIHRLRQEQRERDQIADWLVTFRKLDDYLRQE